MNLKKYNNKLFLFLMLFISLFFINTDYIFARKCEYSYEEETITITTSQKDEKSEVKVDYKIPKKIEHDQSYNYIDGTILTSDKQCLETITVCRFDRNQYSTGWKFATLGLAAIIDAAVGERHIALFGSALDPSTIDDAAAAEFDDISDKSFWESWFWTGESESCKTAEYSGDDKKELKENGNFTSYCAKFVSMYSDIAAAYKKYNACESETGLKKSRCRANGVTEINKEVDKLKNTCNNILQNSGINAKDGCAKSCLGANDLMKTLRDKYGLQVVTTNDCDISSRLVIWGANIVRWVKYIIPVAVIALGILDFIKAIGSDKDDEMKKAQGRFIKRLIAAALIFIVPFLIEFVLIKMGFESNGCGIINL